MEDTLRLYALRTGARGHYRYHCFVEGRGKHVVITQSKKSVYALGALMGISWPLFLGEEEADAYFVGGKSVVEQAAYWEDQRTSTIRRASRATAFFRTVAHNP